MNVTTNMLNTSSDDVEQLTSLSYGFPIWVGQDQLLPFRIVNPSGTDEPVTISADGEYPERLQFSTRQHVDFGSSLTVTARANGCSDVIYCEISIPTNASSEIVQSIIKLNDHTIPLEYEAVETWKANNNPYPDYAGDTTDKILALFASKGTVVEIHRYDPITDKRTLNCDAVMLSERRKHDISKWVDPSDPEFWSSPETDPYRSDLILHEKVFLGGRDVMLPYPLAWPDPDLDYSDTIGVLLPADLHLQRQYTPWGSVTTGGSTLHQRSAYILYQGGLAYSIERVTPAWSEQGEFAFWSAECRLIFHPSGSNRQGWLPWNALYEFNGDRVAHYITTYSRATERYNVCYGGSGS